MSQTGMGTSAPQQSNSTHSTTHVQSELESAKAHAREAMRTALDDVKGSVKEGANTVLQGLSAAATDAKQHAAELAGEAKNRVYGIVEQQKNVGAEQIGGIAEAVHGAADDLQERAPSVARYVHEAASGIERVSDGLRSTTVDDLVDQVEHFARTQRLAFFGAAALAGFAVSRFVKSSGERRAAMQAMGETGSDRLRPGGPRASQPRSDRTPGSATSRGTETGTGFSPEHI